MEMTTFAFTLFLYIYSVGPLSHPRDPMEMTIFPFTLILYIYSVEAPFTHTRPNGNDDISLHSLSLYLLCWGPHDDYSFEGTGRACCSLEHVARLKIPNSPSVWSYLLNTRKIQRKDDIFNHLWIVVEHLVILSYRGKLYKKVFLFQCSALPVTQQHAWRYNN